jgi:hypothetical protein
LTSVKVSPGHFALQFFECADQWRKPMCDYSLHAVASRPAKVGETLVTTSFYGTSTRGFAAKEEPGVRVVCFPEPNSHSNVMSDTIASGWQPEAQVLALPDSARSNRARRIGITMLWCFRTGTRFS